MADTEEIVKADVKEEQEVENVKVEQEENMDTMNLSKDQEQATEGEGDQSSMIEEGNPDMSGVSGGNESQLNMSSSSSQWKRVYLQAEEDLTKEEIIQLWKNQEAYIDQLEARLESSGKKEGELEETREEEEINPQKGLDRHRKEQLLIMKLTAKDQEIQELNAQLAEMKAAQTPTAAMLQSTLLDPAVNLIINKLTKEVDQLKKEGEERQNEMAAWKFTSDSATGKKLMAKCRQLLQENEEIGKMISSGRLSKLEGELAIQKNLTLQMKQNQLELDEFMAELDEDVEGLQCTIVMLQQQLREAKDQNAKLTEQLQKLGVKEEENNTEEAKETEAKEPESIETETKQEEKTEEDSPSKGVKRPTSEAKEAVPEKKVLRSSKQKEETS